MSWLKRRPVPILVLGTSAIGGAAYRVFGPGNSSHGSLNPQTFTPYTIVDKQQVSSTSSIFTLRNSNGAPHPESVRELQARGTWSVQIKQPQLQIARAYTPLPPTSDSTKNGGSELKELRLLIRQETGGEVSTYLHRLPENSTIELRGPHPECELPPNTTEILFLAGGTGIAPAMQFAHALSQKSGSRMHILWANRRREECIGGMSDDDEGTASTLRQRGWLSGVSGIISSVSQMPQANVFSNHDKGVIVDELDALKARSGTVNSALGIQYYVDEEKTIMKPQDITKRITRQPDGPGLRLIILSGPDGFVEYWAGKKIWANGREVQGPLRGQLGRLNLGDWKVIKL